MIDNFGRSQQVTKTAVVSPHGMVSAQHRVAAEIGAALSSPADAQEAVA